MARAHKLRGLEHNARQVLNLCATPHTLAQIKLHFGNAYWVVHTVQNLRQRGHLINGSNDPKRAVYRTRTNDNRTPLEKYWGAPCTT